MGFTIVQETPFDAHKGTSATSHTFTVTGTTAGGALLIAAIMDLGSGAASNATGVTDNKSGGSNSWAQIARGDNASGGGAGIYATGVAAGAITTFTVALANSAPVSAQFWEVTGAAAGSGTGGCDVKSSGNAASGTISSGSSGTPVGAGDLVIGVGGSVNFVGGPTISGGAFTTAGGTFVTHSPAAGGPGAAQSCGITGRLILGAGVTTAQTFTMTSDSTSGAAVALWKSAVATLLPPSRILTQAVQRSVVR